MTPKINSTTIVLPLLSAIKREEQARQTEQALAQERQNKERLLTYLPAQGIDLNQIL